MTARRPGHLLTIVLRLPTKLYDWNAGWLLGHRFCRLPHQGRTSGRRYRTVLEVLTSDPDTGAVIVMSGFGPAADWYRNIRANDVATIEIGRRLGPPRGSPEVPASGRDGGPFERDGSAEQLRDETP